ncbi:MAG: GNAT family N-acetyltransferase [Chloroflexi bacterium]|nr:GNAT family N-acetyltransferase [Chloroflexota bacterium]MDA1145065.1 GNAT family N-acetyltransferase [Chloroflexota bacterium]MQC82950.1 N-acetyltransferase family protein [Chloroflexota bacterium]
MPAVDPIIRPATSDDLPAINAIYNEEIRTGVATWDYEPWTLEARERWFQDHDPAEPVLVAEVDGQVVGFAYLSLYRPKFGYRFTREDTVYLDPLFQGRGLGRRLLQALVDQARGRDIRTLLAVIESSNEASIALHERLGFVRCAHHHEVGYKFGRWLDSVDLELRLSAGGPDEA